MATSTSLDPLLQSNRTSLDALIAALTPKPVGEGELSTRFASLFDPTYQYNASEIGKELDLRAGRFGEDQATAARRLALSRGDFTGDIGQRRSRFGEDQAIADKLRSYQQALTSGQTQEQLAAGGASGNLAGQYLQRQLKPYQDEAAAAKLQSSRFGQDIQTELERGLRGYGQTSEDAARQGSRFGYDTAEERRKRLLQNQQARSQARSTYLSDPNNVYEFSY